MSVACDAFLVSLRRCRDLIAVAEHLRMHVALHTAADDVLRAALVQGISALDRYVHEKVRIGMLAAARGEISRTAQFHSFALPLSGALRGYEDGTAVEMWLGPLIVEQHSIATFQRADKIADAIRLVCTIDAGLWPGVGAAIGIADTKQVKERLDLLVDRRNAIAHEDDTGASGERAPIDAELVASAIDFIEDVGSAIDHIVDTSPNA